LRNVIYYFTGTGNTLEAVRRVAKGIGDCELLGIAATIAEAKGSGMSDIAVDSNVERVGIAFPVYYYGLPAIVHDFFRALRVSGNPYIYCVATRGGSSGYGSFAQASAYLRKIGKKLDAGFSVLMPENYPVLYNPTDVETARKMLEAASGEIDVIAAAVAEKRPFREGWQNPFASTFISRPVNAWFVSGVRSSDKKFVASSACISCGKCAKACGVGNISLENGKPVWHGRCEQCFGCYHACPARAIDFGKSTIGKRQYLNPVLKA